MSEGVEVVVTVVPVPGIVEVVVVEVVPSISNEQASYAFQDMVLQHD